MPNLRGWTANLFEKFGTAFGLPEMGFSERAAGGNTLLTGIAPTSRGVLTSTDYRTGQPGYVVPQTAFRGGQISAPQLRQNVTTGGGSTAGGGGGGQIGQPQVPGITPPSPSDPTGQELFRNIDTGYENSQAQLRMAESELGEQTAQRRNEIAASFQPSMNRLAEQETQRYQDIGQREQSAQRTKQSRVQEAYDIYNQLNQANTAKLAALGISSSSVSAALAESLGRDTAKRINDIAQKTGDYLQALDIERGSVKQYVQDRMMELEAQKANQLGQLQNTFMAGLNQIRSQSMVTEQDRANARANLLSQYQAQRVEIEKYNAQLANNITLWQLQRQASLDDAGKKLSQVIEDPNQYLQTLADMGMVPTSAEQDYRGIRNIKYGLPKDDLWTQQ